MARLYSVVVSQMTLDEGGRPVQLTYGALISADSVSQAERLTREQKRFRRQMRQVGLSPATVPVKVVKSSAARGIVLA